MARKLILSGNGNFDLLFAVPAQRWSIAFPTDQADPPVLDLGGATLSFFGIFTDSDTGLESPPVRLQESGRVNDASVDLFGESLTSITIEGNGFTRYFVKVTGWTKPLTIWYGPM